MLTSGPSAAILPRTRWHLHSGDLGWYWRFGAETVTAALGVWSLHGPCVAIGLTSRVEVIGFGGQSAGLDPLPERLDWTRRA